MGSSQLETKVLQVPEFYGGCGGDLRCVDPNVCGNCAGRREPGYSNLRNKACQKLLDIFGLNGRICVESSDRVSSSVTSIVSPFCVSSDSHLHLLVSIRNKIISETWEGGRGFNHSHLPNDTGTKLGA